MRIGTAAIDITPAPGIDLGGFLFRAQPSIAVHDPLFVRCLYLETGPGARLLWLHADLLGLDRDFVAAIRQWAARELGLSAHEVVVSTTHTHSGPATLPLIHCGACDPKYHRWLRVQFEAAASSALTRTEPVSVIEALGECDLGVDRRRGTSAHVDPRVGVVGSRRPDGTFAAVIANYAIHSVALGHENRRISGDIAGRAAETLSNSLPGKPVTLFTIGAAANINPPRVGVDLATMQQWGDRLANSACAALDRGTASDDPILASASLDIDVPLHPADQAWIGATADRVAALVDGRSGRAAERYRDAVAIWRSRIVESLERGELPRTIPLEMHVIRIGDSTFVCIAAEMFSRLADDLRAALDDPRVFVVGYGNGLIGYVPPEAAFDEGGYEVDSAFVFYGGLPVARGAFEMIRDRAAALVKSVASRRTPVSVA